MNNRIKYLDSAGGILLINMMLLHCWQWANLPYDATWLRIFSFFMPWFFFKAGMFFKPDSNDIIIRKSSKRLLVPYVIYTILGTIVLCITLLIFDEFDLTCFVITFFSSALKTGSVPGNLPLWFLLSLFLVRIIYNAFYNKFRDKTIWLFIAIPILLKTISERMNVYLPLYMFNVSSGLFFYLLGHKLKGMQFNWYTIVSLTLFYLSSVLFFPQMVDMRTNQVVSGNYCGWLIISLIGILAMNSICVKIMNNKNIFSIIGNDTMQLYCWHWIIILLVSCIGFIIKQNKYMYFFIELISLIVFLPGIIQIERKIKKFIFK